MNGEDIKFVCSCGQRLRVPAGAAGKKVKCAKCGQSVAVPAQASKTAEAAPRETEAGGATPPGGAQAPRQPSQETVVKVKVEGMESIVKVATFWNRLLTDYPPTYVLWIMFGTGCGCLIPLGLVFCITVIGAIIGIPLSMLGGLPGAGGGLLLWRYIKRGSEKSAAEKKSEETGAS